MTSFLHHPMTSSGKMLRNNPCYRELIKDWSLLTVPHRSLSADQQNFFRDPWISLVYQSEATILSILPITWNIGRPNNLTLTVLLQYFIQSSLKSYYFTRPVLDLYYTYTILPSHVQPTTSNPNSKPDQTGFSQYRISAKMNSAPYSECQT